MKISTLFTIKFKPLWRCLLPPLVIMAMAALAAGCGGKPSVTLSMAGLPNANPDITGRPSPTSIKMFELRSDVIFRQADMMGLFADPAGTLGAEMVALDEITLVPGEALEIVYSPHQETRYVGVLASFRRATGDSNWKVLKPVAQGKKNKVAIEVNSNSMILIADSETKKWNPENAVESYQSKSKPAPSEAAKPKRVDPHNKPAEDTLEGYKKPKPPKKPKVQRKVLDRNKTAPQTGGGRPASQVTYPDSGGSGSSGGGGLPVAVDYTPPSIGISPGSPVDVKYPSIGIGR